MQRLVLIRGIPGSGKSTLAAILAQNPLWKHLEADQFFLGLDGIYQFDPSKLPAAHTWCQEQTEKALRNGLSVVVANTFSRRWEMAPYQTLAQSFGILCNICTAEGDFPSIHNVPDGVITAMRNRWEAA